MRSMHSAALALEELTVSDAEFWGETAWPPSGAIRLNQTFVHIVSGGNRQPLRRT